VRGGLAGRKQEEERQEQSCAGRKRRAPRTVANKKKLHFLTKRGKGQGKGGKGIFTFTPSNQKASPFKGLG